jgi:DeoR/GlpR family transcriptional regulator of sugar metabolism
MLSDLYPEERQEQIILLLEREGRVNVADLADRFDVSTVTIRSDLDLLAKQGLLVRTRGGAIRSDQADLELDFQIRRRLHPVQKRRIGAAAAAIVGDGESIVLDASTTALAILEHIRDRRQITIITNGLLAAMALLEMPGLTVLMPSGFLYRDSASLVGRGNREFLEQFNFHKGFFGAKGFTIEEGLTDINSSEVAIKKELVARAKQVIAVVDSSKWGRVGFVSYATVDQVDTVITDDGAPADMVTGLREADVQVIIA